MSSFRRRREETEGQHTQAWDNLAGLNQSFATHDLPSDQHSIFTVEDFDHDVDQSVHPWDNDAAFVTPSTSTDFHSSSSGSYNTTSSSSNASDFCNTTSNQVYPTDDTWGFNQAITDYDINGDGSDLVTFNAQLENIFANDFTFAGPVSQSSARTVHSEPSKITKEKIGDMDMRTWLNGMYAPGFGIADNTIPPRPGPSSRSALDLPYRPRTPADDQVSESSADTSGTSYFCRTCSKGFNNKDDLRRHQRFHNSKRHTCRVCGKGFVHPKDLRRHKPTHSANRLQRPCPVDGCTTAAGRLDNLKRHIQNKHPEFDTDAWTVVLSERTLTQGGESPVKHDKSRQIGADERLEDSIKNAKSVSEKSKIIGQVDASNDASNIGFKGPLPISANLFSGVSTPDILPISTSTSIGPKEQNAGESLDSPFPNGSPVQDRGIGEVHSEQNGVSTSQESHRGEVLSPVPTQNMDDVRHFAHDGGKHAGPEKKRPMELNHAISYVNQIKNRFATQHGIYKQFSEILQAYQHDSMPAKEFQEQVTRILDSTPDLLEKFERSIPESTPETASQHTHGHSDFSSTETANLQDSRVYDSVGCTGPREPVFKHDMRSLTPDSVSDKGFSETGEKDDNSNEVKKYIVESLMQKVYDLLGFSPSEFSESSSSSGSSFDDDEDKYRHGENVSLVDSGEEIPYTRRPGSNESSQGQTQNKGTNTGSQLAGNNSNGPLPSLGVKRRKGTAGSTSEDEDEGKGKKRRENSRPVKGGRLKPRFACPFYKKSPEIHGRNASCLWPGFDSISRLKEHLYRVHVSHDDGDTTCPRCRAAFESGQELIRHLAMAERCVQTEAPNPEDGLNGDQIMRLRSRDRGADPENKWKNIYRICHNLPDNTETPWPYCDQDSPTDQVLEGYDWYQRQHLSHMIRERLQQQPDIRQLLENVTDQLPAIIRDCQNDLYRRFTGSRANRDPTDEHLSFADDAAHTAFNSVERAMEPTPQQRSTNPPVAFEAPPNTDNGMTTSEAQQVLDSSGQRGDRRSDSGYGSGVVEPHKPVELGEYTESQTGLAVNATQPVIFSGGPQYLQGSHQLQDPSIADVIQNSAVQNTEEGALLGEAGRNQMPEWGHEFPSAAVDGRQTVTQNPNSANNPGNGILGGTIDWPVLDWLGSTDWPELDGNDLTFGI